MQRYAVVVDPVGSGQEYPGAFREAGVEVVAVLATAELPEAYKASWHPENFQHIHIFDGDLVGLASTLRGYDPICLIPGAETGVELADALVELVVPGTGNVPALAPARRDKWAMAEALRAAGVPHLRQYCSADPAEIGRWLMDSGLQDEPVVFKPPKSAGSDNVNLSQPGTDWRPLFDQIYGQTNRVGLRNDAVLVQEFAEGTEYLIDTYTVDGRHGLVDVCRYTKIQLNNRVGMYDLVVFLPPDHPEVAGIWPYTQQVLDAVGVRNGCGHVEVVVTKNGPRLLEIGARTAGGGHNMIAQLAVGDNHIHRTVAHQTRGEFQESYRLEQHVCSVVVSAPHDGIWRNADIFDDVDKLPTFWMKWFACGTGDRVEATRDYYTMLGWVVLASPDEAAMKADLQIIEDLKRRVRIDPLPAGEDSDSG